MKDESYKAENADEIVWLRLNRLKSPNLCKKLIESKAKKESVRLEEGVIDSKAVGLASAIESAIGYWEQTSKSLNSKVLSRYYFMLQLTIAEQVSGVTNYDDLASVQKHTESGHGLGTIRDLTRTFPKDFYTFSITGGHFYSYQKSLSFQPKTYSFNKRPRKFKEIEETDKLINIVDLFRRIPELHDVIEEYTDQHPLSFRIGHSDKNIENDIDEAKEYIQKTGKFVLKAPATSPQKTTIITFYEDSSKLTPQYLESLGFPFYDFGIEKGILDKRELVNAKFDHDTQHWFEKLKPYSSNYSQRCLIAPMWGKIADPIAINYTLMYTLSIIVRYLPDLWFEIKSGKLDHYGSLIEYYVSVMDHVLPLKMLERITDSAITIHQPGSIFGPI